MRTGPNSHALTVNNRCNIMGMRMGMAERDNRPLCLA